MRRSQKIRTFLETGDEDAQASVDWKNTKMENR